jgi:GNAT superfamily N-acetyltransferase
MNNKFIFHHRLSDWGGEVLVMESAGKAFARTYWFNDDKKSIYFDMLSVCPENRKNGIATELIKMHEEMGKKSEVTASYLAVVKDSWMRRWYKRLGYKYHKRHADKNLIWMEKLL